LNDVPKILFLCTGNACRSQMAQGWAMKLMGGRVWAWSAGTTPAGLSSRAVQVMREAGIDISNHRCKHVDELKHIAFDCVITVCDRANENCPAWLGGGTRMHVPFDDPAHAEGDREQALEVFRRVRDEIRDFITYLPERLAKD